VILKPCAVSPTFTVTSLPPISMRALAPSTASKRTVTEVAFGVVPVVGVVLVPVVGVAAGTELDEPEPEPVAVLVDPLVLVDPDVVPEEPVELVVGGEPVEPLAVEAAVAAAAASCGSGANGLRVASPASITAGAAAAAGGRGVAVALGTARGRGRLAAPVDPVLLLDPPVSIGITTKNSSATRASAPAPTRASIFGSRAVAGAFSA